MHCIALFCTLLHRGKKPSINRKQRDMLTKYWTMAWKSITCNSDGKFVRVAVTSKWTCNLFQTWKQHTSVVCTYSADHKHVVCTYSSAHKPTINGGCDILVFKCVSVWDTKICSLSGTCSLCSKTWSYLRGATQYDI